MLKINKWNLEQHNATEERSSPPRCQSYDSQEFKKLPEKERKRLDSKSDKLFISSRSRFQRTLDILPPPIHEWNGSIRPATAGAAIRTSNHTSRRNISSSCSSRRRRPTSKQSRTLSRPHTAKKTYSPKKRAEPQPIFRHTNALLALHSKLILTDSTTTNSTTNSTQQQSPPVTASVTGTTTTTPEIRKKLGGKKKQMSIMQRYCKILNSFTGASSDVESFISNFEKTNDDDSIKITLQDCGLKTSRSCGVENNDFEALINALRQPKVQKHWPGINGTTKRPLFTVHLDLTGNDLNDFDCDEIATLLIDQPAITSLDLSRNDIRTSGAVKILHAVHSRELAHELEGHLPVISSLDLSQNHIGQTLYSQISQRLNSIRYCNVNINTHTGKTAASRQKAKQHAESEKNRLVTNKVQHHSYTRTTNGDNYSYFTLKNK